MKLPPLFLSLLLASTAAAVATDASSSAQVTTQTRVVPAFKRLELRAPIATEVHEGRAARVSVQIDDALQPKLVTRVSGDTLIVELTRTEGHTDIASSARVSIDLPTLTGITVEGPGDTTVEGSGPHPQMDIALEGPGDLHWSGDADALHCRLDGPGDAVLRGHGKNVTVTASGPGDLDASAFPITSGTFQLSGPGDVRADLHGGDVSVVVSGPGSFRYSGVAHFVRSEVSGPGEIRKI